MIYFIYLLMLGTFALATTDIIKYFDTILKITVEIHNDDEITVRKPKVIAILYCISLLCLIYILKH